MKKLLFTLLGIAAMILTTPVQSAPSESDLMIRGDWKKSKEGTWAGKQKMWYKLNTTDATLWVSADGKNWNKSEDGMWQDKTGNWLKIYEGKLVWSADGGKTWSEVPEWKWEGEDGKWYKFDSKWGLWVM